MIRSARRRLSRSTSSDDGSRSAAGHCAAGRPRCSANAHQVAKPTSPSPSWAQNGPERGLTGRRARRGEHGAERLPLGRPRGVAVEQVAGGARHPQVLGLPLHQRAVGAVQVGGLADVLHPDVHGLTNRRVVGRYGEGSIRPTGSAAWSGLTSRKSAPRSRPLQASSSDRSARSPSPHDWDERTEYSWVMKPHRCRSQTCSGSSIRRGVTTSEQALSCDGVLATSRCHPRGRSDGSVNVASPTSAPSTTRGSTQRSTCSPRARPPSSSTTCSRTGSPSRTCTGTCTSSPARTTTTAGSVRRQGASTASCSDSSTSSADPAGDPERGEDGDDGGLADHHVAALPVPVLGGDAVAGRELVEPWRARCATVVVLAHVRVAPGGGGGRSGRPDPARHPTRRPRDGAQRPRRVGDRDLSPLPSASTWSRSSPRAPAPPSPTRTAGSRTRPTPAPRSGRPSRTTCWPGTARAGPPAPTSRRGWPSCSAPGRWGRRCGAGSGCSSPGAPPTRSTPCCSSPSPAPTAPRWSACWSTRWRSTRAAAPPSTPGSRPRRATCWPTS